MHEQLLMLGILGTPDTPSYHDARTAYLAADVLLDFLGIPNAGNQCLIWRVFADNELGVTAGPDADDDYDADGQHDHAGRVRSGGRDRADGGRRRREPP